MNRSDAEQQFLNRPQYHGPLGLLTVLTLFLYIFELFLIHRHRFHPPFSSLFFLFWKNQAILDIGTLLTYFLFGFVRNLPVTWGVFEASNGTWFPAYVEVTVSFFFFAEIFGVAMISAQRLIFVVFPFGQCKELLLRCPPFVLSLVHLVFPILFILPYFAVSPPHFYYDVDQHTVQLDTSMHTGIQSRVLGPLCLVCTLFSFVCYCLVFHRIFSSRKARSSRLNRALEKVSMRVDVLAFALFCSLVLVFAYLVVHLVGAALNDKGVLAFITSYIFLPNFMLALTNPFCLLLSSTFREHAAEFIGLHSLHPQHDNATTCD